jgi:hypothetical protein
MAKSKFRHPFLVKQFCLLSYVLCLMSIVFCLLRYGFRQSSNQYKSILANIIGLPPTSHISHLTSILTNSPIPIDSHPIRNQ